MLWSRGGGGDGVLTVEGGRPVSSGSGYPEQAIHAACGQPLTSWAPLPQGPIAGLQLTLEASTLGPWVRLRWGFTPPTLPARDGTAPSLVR